MVLIINLGLKSIRFIVFDSYGEVQYTDSELVNTRVFDGKVEQDAREWDKHFNSLLKRLQNHPSGITNEIDKISSTTSSSCNFVIGKDGSIISKVLMVSDKRATKIAKDLNDSKFNVRVSSSYSICKAIWFRENNFLNDERLVIGANEWIHYKLTGKFIIDPLNASKFLVNELEEYRSDIHEYFYINKENLPEIRNVGDVFDLDKKFKNIFLKECRYIMTTYDAICAVIGSSFGEEGNYCDVSGTVTSVRTLSRASVLEAKGSTVLNQGIKTLNTNIIGHSNNLGGGLLEWLRQSFYPKEGDRVYPKINTTIQKKKHTPVLFIPFLLGERAPFKVDIPHSQFYGLNRLSKRSDIALSVMEGAGFVTKSLLENIEKYHPKATSLSVSGGLARMHYVNQIKANLLQVPIHVCRNFESTSTGCFILCMSGTDSKKLWENIKKYVSFSHTINPEPSQKSYFQKKYALYKSISQNKYLINLSSELKNLPDNSINVRKKRNL